MSINVFETKVRTLRVQAMFDQMGLDPWDLQETWDNFVAHEKAWIALDCMNGVCVHSPNSQVCLRDMEVENSNV